MNTTTYDPRELRPAEAREGALSAALPGLIQGAQRAAGWSRILSGVDPHAITSRKALAALPVTRKGDLKALQQLDAPFGGLNTTPPGQLRRLFMSPGPIFDPEGHGPDWWRTAAALHAAGIRPGDVLQNCFSYHMTPAAFMIEAGAAALGCPVIPAGIGNTEQQVEAMTVLKPRAYVGTPSFLRIILERAAEMNVDLRHVQKALVAAEALPPSLRQWFIDRGMSQVQQWYGTADLGCVAFETCTDGVVHPGMVLSEDLLLEIVKPGAGEVCAPGEVGEIVITMFNPDYPLIRFGTGDLTKLLPEPSPCGRTNQRIAGWMGRADQTTKVRGLFVHPAQINDISKRFPELGRVRMVITGSMGQDDMVLKAESGEQHDGLAYRLRDAIRDITKLRGEVELVAPGSLPNDGKLIEDARSYQ
ncbi:AMP-dependent synthetase [beta proteobacterium AAP99]|nr:AMP-dependent synthetase [beta proteobacterium AAP99]